MPRHYQVEQFSEDKWTILAAYPTQIAATANLRERFRTDRATTVDAPTTRAAFRVRPVPKKRMSII
jgi:hypothetical protein